MGEFVGQGLACVRSERVVFTGVAFVLRPEGALVLTGPNGSGKSSLLRLMTGLGPPAAGVLTWDGADVNSEPVLHRQRVQYVGHLDAIKPSLTVVENLRIWAALRDGNGASADERAMAALDAFGLERIADVPGRYLSAGQRRRLALARVLTAPAPLWLLDEPRTSLDSDAMERLDRVIARHRAEGGSVVLSMHGSFRPEGSTILDLTESARGQEDRP